jgi:hypothetical protein
MDAFGLLLSFGVPILFASVIIAVAFAAAAYFVKETKA